MSQDEQKLWTIEELIAERREQLFRASLLDQGNQVLSTGEALLQRNFGTFWPDREDQREIVIYGSAALRRLDDDRLIPISGWLLSPAHGLRTHYYFLA